MFSLLSGVYEEVKKMIHSASFFCLCFLLWTGVFGADTDEVKSVSVLEGDSVTLHTDVKIQTDDHILWMFGSKEKRIAEIYRQIINIDVINTTFGKRLQMDRQTGSLIIRNIRTEHTGLYKLQIISSSGTSYKRSSVTVYAPLPAPVITSNSLNCSSSSSSSSSQKCSLLCSAVNVSHVTLSWFKGNSVLSSISASDLSISLSLSLEVDYQENNTYSCVVAYSFTNKTTHLHNTDLCQPCPERDERLRLCFLIAVTALLLVVITVCLMNCHRKRKQSKNKVKAQEEEILYADTTFCAYQVKRTDVIAADQTEYSTVRHDRPWMKEESHSVYSGDDEFSRIN